MIASLLGFIADIRYRKISHTATVNDLLKEFFRKTIHICASLVPVLAAWNYKLTLVSLSFVVCFYSLCEYLRLTGKSIPVISSITAYASRRRDEGKFVLGPVTMGLGVLLTLVIFPPETASIGIFALAFGDGIASLAGKLFGNIQIPHTKGKTLAGSFSCFIAVFLSTQLVTGDPLRSLAVGFFTTCLEAIPLKEYDNLLIPVLVSGFVTLLP